MDAKIGNTIVDTAPAFFASTGEIASGESVEDIAFFDYVRSLSSFDDEPFDNNNLHCSYTVVNN